MSPASLQIPAGGSGFVTVTLSRLNGFAAPVALSGAGLPAGVVASGTIPSGSSTLQLPVAVDSGVAVTSYTGISLQGLSGNLTHSASLALTVAPALPASHLRDDLVQASGGRQTGGTLENHAVAREGMAVQAIKDASGTTGVRHGFLPSGSPTDH